MARIKPIIKRLLAGIYLGQGFFGKIRSVTALVMVSVLKLVSLRFNISGRTTDLYIRTGSEAAMLCEVFYDKEYELPDSLKPRKILDIGANVGFASVYFACRDNSSEVVAVEPDPQNHQILNMNIQSIPNIKIIKSAVSDVSGQKNFYTKDGQGMSSSFSQRSGFKEISIRSYSIIDLLDLLNWSKVDLVKFDIEGAEWDVFKTAPLDRINALVGEYHEDLVKRPVSEFTSLFAGFKSTIKTISKHRFIIFLDKINKSS